MTVKKHQKRKKERKNHDSTGNNRDLTDLCERVDEAVFTDRTFREQGEAGQAESMPLREPQSHYRRQKEHPPAVPPPFIHKC